MIKIYTDKAMISTHGKYHMFPLVDVLLSEKESKLESYFLITDEFIDADIIILPYYYDYLIKLKNSSCFTNLLEISKRINKPIWLAIGGDLPLKFNNDSCYVFKMAAFKSTLQPKNAVMPVFIADPIAKFYDNQFTTIAFSEMPKIGYVGHAKAGFIKFLRTVYIYLNYNSKVFFKQIVSDYSPLYFSSHIRFKYLKLLEKSTFLYCNFIYRDKYRAGAKSDLEIKRTTQEFYDNIKNTQYTFCIRGGGNFSVRLYESMAMGRIPIQIDTDCVLPLEDLLDWKKYILLFPEKEIKSVPNQISKFHHSFNDTDFEKHQFQIRKFWQDNFTRENYFIHIHNLFLKGKL